MNQLTKTPIAKRGRTIKKRPWLRVAPRSIGIKISELPELTDPAATDEITTLSGGVNYRSPLSALGSAGAREQVYLLDFIPTSEHGAIYAGTSTYDAGDAMDECIASVSVDVNNAGPEVILPYGKLRFNRPIQIKKTIILKGHGTGQAGRFATILEFATDQHGIIVHSYNTWDIDKGARAWDSGDTYLVGGYIVVNVTPRRYYECLVAPGAPSTVAPTHTSGDAATADGYEWRYIAGVSPYSGAASVLRDFEIVSLGGTTGHGLWCRARVLVENVRIESFPQNGLHIHATAGPGGIIEGNANNCHFSNMRITNSGGNGVHVVGADANAGLFDHIDSSANDGMGFNDESFLGNCYLAPHTNGNGSRGQVSYGGNRYFTLDSVLAGIIAPGSLANWLTGTTYTAGTYVENAVGGVIRTYECMVAGGGTSTSAPIHTSSAGDVPKPDGYTWRFTGPQVWVLIGVGGVHSVFPLWVSGTTYILGHSFRTTSNNVSGGIILGLYDESGQPACTFVSPWIIIGSGTFIAPGSTGFRITGHGVISPFEVAPRTGGPVDYTLTFNRLDDEAITLQADGDTTHGLALMWNENVSCWSMQWARTANYILYTGNTSTMTGGRSAPIAGGEIMFPKGFWTGSSTVNSRKITNGTAKPASGEWARGDIVFNLEPAIGEPLAWICVTSGTPGTWAMTDPLVAA